jgi:hypothetical protein
MKIIMKTLIPAITPVNFSTLRVPKRITTKQRIIKKAARGLRITLSEMKIELIQLSLLPYRSPEAASAHPRAIAAAEIPYSIEHYQKERKSKKE